MRRGYCGLYRGIRLDPSDPFVFSSRGIVYMRKGQYEKAITDFTKTIRLEPKFAAAYRARGLAYKHLGKLSEAEADFAEAKKRGYNKK